MLSGEDTPLLAGVIPVFEAFITGWEKLIENHAHLAPYIQPGLDRLNQYYSKTDNTRAYVIGMCTYLSVLWEFSFADGYSKLSILLYKCRGSRTIGKIISVTQLWTTFEILSVSLPTTHGLCVLFIDIF